eukprot:59725-Lingulodinium_polyedra.AAC.1
MPSTMQARASCTCCPCTPETALARRPGPQAPAWASLPGMAAPSPRWPGRPPGPTAAARSRGPAASRPTTHRSRSRSRARVFTRARAARVAGPPP